MGCDEGWGTISPSHAAFVAGLVLPGRAVLDAACGTGRYWPALPAAGLEITGTDQSAAMLGVLLLAPAAHPGEPRPVR